MADSIADLARKALSAGVKADEIVLRVSEYQADGKIPSGFQAVVRFRDRTKAWGVGIATDPIEALELALTRAIEYTGPPPAPRVRQRIRPNP